MPASKGETHWYISSSAMLHLTSLQVELGCTIVTKASRFTVTVMHAQYFREHISYPFASISLVRKQISLPVFIRLCRTIPDN